MSDETKFFAEAFGPSSPETDQDQAPAKEEIQDQADQPPEPDQKSSSPEPGPDQAPADGDQSEKKEGGQEDPPAEPGPDQSDKGKKPEKSEPGKDKDPDLETLEKKAHGYESMLGRLERERDKNRRLMQELEQIKGQLDQRQGKDGKAPAKSGPEPIKDIPENLAEDLKVFSVEFPEYTDLIREDGPDGQRLRKGLEKYGPEWAAAAAEGVSARREVHAYKQQLEEEKAMEQQARKQAEAQEQERRSRDHFQTLFSEVPEYGELRSNPQRASELEAFHQNLFSWIEEKPYREAARMKQIVEDGDAYSVAEVLKKFQEETRPESNTEGDPPPRRETQQAAAQAAAVPSRSGSPPRGRPDPNDEGSAFREAFGRK